MANADVYVAFFLSGSAFGTGPASAASSSTGSPVAFATDVFLGIGSLIVPEDYQSGTDLGTSTAFYEGKSFASLGLTPGTQTYDYTSGFPLFAALAVSDTQGAFDPTVIDKVIVSVGVSAVPLPASAPLFGAALLGLAGLGYAAKRKKAFAAG